jgi:Protein kinase domain
LVAELDTIVCCVGQAVVQVVEDARTRIEYAAKFYLFRSAFEDEKALYEDPLQPLGHFLPEVHCIIDSPVEGLLDAKGAPLPPCIVMEKGESLDIWAASTGDGLDMVTGLQVGCPVVQHCRAYRLCLKQRCTTKVSHSAELVFQGVRLKVQVLMHIADRLKALHAAGYVHRDVKPGNVMWLPRTKRWTLIDFGCVGKTNEHARIAFSFPYAAPEALAAYNAGAKSLKVTEALDAWSVGILAIEIFTGQPVFDILQTRDQVC